MDHAQNGTPPATLEEFDYCSKSVARFLRSFGNPKELKLNLGTIVLWGPNSDLWIEPWADKIVSVRKYEQPIRIRPWKETPNQELVGRCANLCGAWMMSLLWEMVFRESPRFETAGKHAAVFWAEVDKFIAEKLRALKKRVAFIIKKQNYSEWLALAETMEIERVQLVNAVAQDPSPAATRQQLPAEPAPNEASAIVISPEVAEQLREAGRRVLTPDRIAEICQAAKDGIRIANERLSAARLIEKPALDLEAFTEAARIAGVEDHGKMTLGELVRECDLSAKRERWKAKLLADELKQQPDPPALTPHQKRLNARNDQLILLRETHKLAGTKNEAAKLNAIANKDPVIEQIGLKVTTDIVREVIGLRKPKRRNKKD